MVDLFFNILAVPQPVISQQSMQPPHKDFWQIEVLFALALPQAYSYRYHKPLVKGVRVLVSLGQQQRVAVVLSAQAIKSDRTLKPIEAEIDSQPLLPAAVNAVAGLDDCLPSLLARRSLAVGNTTFFLASGRIS